MANKVSWISSDSGAAPPYEFHAFDRSLDRPGGPSGLHPRGDRKRSSLFGARRRPASSIREGTPLKYWAKKAISSSDDLSFAPFQPPGVDDPSSHPALPGVDDLSSNFPPAGATPYTLPGEPRIRLNEVNAGYPPEDAYGEETFPEARVWKVYNGESGAYDLERIAAWKDALDVLLVFVSLANFVLILEA